MTPLELLNRHKMRLKINVSKDLTIDEKLIKNSFKIADSVLCDDSNMYTKRFLNYLKQTQKNSQLLMVNQDESDINIVFSQNFTNKNKKVSFVKSNPIKKALKLTLSMLCKYLIYAWLQK